MAAVYDVPPYHTKSSIQWSFPRTVQWCHQLHHSSFPWRYWPSSRSWNDSKWDSTIWFVNNERTNCCNTFHVEVCYVSYVTWYDAHPDVRQPWRTFNSNRTLYVHTHGCLLSVAHQKWTKDFKIIWIDLHVFVLPCSTSRDAQYNGNRFVHQSTENIYQPTGYNAWIAIRRRN